MKVTTPPKDAGIGLSKLLEKTLASLDEAILVVNPDTRAIVSCNRAAEEIFGYPHEEIIGRNTEFLHVDHAHYEAFGKELFPALNATGVFHKEFMMRRRDGSLFPTEMTVTEIRDDEGNRVGVVSAVRDVTYRVAAEREANLQRDNFMRILNAVTDGIYIVNSAFDIEYVNPVIEREFGEVEGRKCYTYFHGRKEQCPWCKNEKVFNGESVRWEWSSSKTGKTYELLDTPIMNPDGSISKFEIFHDITERKLMENALRESEERYRSLFENSHAVLLVINPADGSIVDANPAAVAYYGWTREELQRKKIMDINTLTPDQVRAEMDMARAEKRNHFIFKHRRAYGEPRDVEVYSGPIKAHGKDLLYSIIFDITERKRAEETLRQRETLLRNYFDLGQVGMAITSLDQKWLRVNNRLCEILGYTKDELTSMTWTELTHPDDLEPDLEQFRKLLAGEIERYAMDKRFVHKNGNIVQTHLTVACQRKSDRSVEYVIASVEDITERKRAEDELKRFFNLVPDMVCVASTEGYFLKINPMWEATLGYSEQEILSTPFLDFIHPDDRDATMSEVARQIGGGATMHFVNRYHCKDGRYKWLEWMATPSPDKKQLFAAARDITMRKQAEMALAQSELNYRTVADFTNDWETWRNPEGRFRYVSPSCERITGYPAERFISDPDFLTSIIHGHDVAAYNEHLATSHALVESGRWHEGEQERVTFRITRRDGEVRWIEHVCQRVFDENGVWLGNRGSNRDISDLVAAREQAEAATKLKDKFVSLVAHDLRSPFTSMMGLLRIFTERKSLLSNDEDKKIVDTVFKSGERMLGMIDQLLKISRLQTGQITPQPRFFNGHMSVVFTINAIGHSAAQKGIEIINDVPADIRLYADTALFDEVLLNLMTNAIKFCSRGDKITVFTPPGLKSAIAIRDTGKGVGEKMLPDIFRHDVKTTSIGTDGELGTGLGLPYSYDIMKAHGGELTVESATGKGSLFCAMLPYARPLALVVDDEPMALLIVRSHLEKIGVDVVEASDGAKALSAVNERRPHIIITDIMMDGMDGFDLLDRLKQDISTRGIPVIVMTSVDGEMRDKVLRRGADDFVGKPIIGDDFLPRVRRFVG